MSFEKIKNVYKNILNPIFIAILIILLAIVLGIFSCILIDLIKYISSFNFWNSVQIYLNLLGIILIFSSAFIIGLIFKTKRKESFSLIQRLFISIYVWFFLSLPQFIFIYQNNQFNLNNNVWANLFSFNAINSFSLFFGNIIILCSPVYIALALTEKINVEKETSIFSFIKSKLPLSIKLASITFSLYLCFLILSSFYPNPRIMLSLPIAIAYIFIIYFYTKKSKKELSLKFKLNYALYSSLLQIMSMVIMIKEAKIWLYFLPIFIVAYFLTDSINKIVLLRLNIKDNYKITNIFLRYLWIFVTFVVVFVPIYIIKSKMVGIAILNIIVLLLPLFVVNILLKFLYKK